MDEKESKSPWDELAQELGAEPSSEAFQRNQPPSTEIPAEASPDQQDLPEQSPSDWNALADSLGLEVPEPPKPEAEPASKQAEETPVSSELQRDEGCSDIGIDDEACADSLPPLPSEVDQIMEEGDWDSELATSDEEGSETEDEASETEDITGMSGDVAKNAFDALFNASGSALAIPPSEPTRERPPLDTSLGTDEPVDSLDPQEKASDSDDDEEERPKRKRPRRRRGRGRGRGGQKADSEQTPSEETAGDQEPLNGEDREEPSEADASSDDESTDDKKPRRRRSRRRPRRSASSDDPARNVATQEAVLSEVDEDMPESRDSSSRDRVGHRNMPTWTEALSVIIEGNLERHSKAPSRQSPSRGRARGGRRRKKTN